MSSWQAGRRMTKHRSTLLSWTYSREPWRVRNRATRRARKSLFRAHEGGLSPPSHRRLHGNLRPTRHAFRPLPRHEDRYVRFGWSSDLQPVKHGRARCFGLTSGDGSIPSVLRRMIHRSGESGRCRGLKGRGSKIHPLLLCEPEVRRGDLLERERLGPVPVLDLPVLLRPEPSHDNGIAPSLAGLS